MTVGETIPDNVIYISEYLERKTAPTEEELRESLKKVQKKMGDVALEQMLLASEKSRIEAQLRQFTPES